MHHTVLPALTQLLCLPVRRNERSQMEPPHNEVADI